MDSFKKCMALIAVIALLLLSLFSGFISATSAEEPKKEEGQRAMAAEAVSSSQGEELGGGLLEPGEGESLEPQEEGKGEAPEEPEAPEVTEEDGGEEDVAQEGNPSQSVPGEKDKNATVGEGTGGPEEKESGTPAEGGPGKEVIPHGGLPGAEGGLLSTPGSLAGDGVVTPGTGAPASEVLALVAYTSVTPETVDPWQSGNAQNECEEAGCSCPYAYKIDNWASQGMDGSYDTGVGNTIYISNSDGYTFDWSSDWPVCCVIVKGGTGANIFRYNGAYGDAGLYAPFRPQNTGSPTYGISHVTFCFCGGQEEGGSICGTKWEDLDCDGKGDQPVDGVTVILRDAAGKEVARAQTSNGGKYCFADLEPGDYTVLEDLSVGGLDREWYAKCPASGSHAVTLPEGQDISGIDFVNARFGKICGLKFLDADHDGVWDEGLEPGMANVTIKLWKGMTFIGEVQTDENGRYCFTRLMPGTYKVKEIVPCGYDATTPNPVWVTLKCGEEKEVDFGNAGIGKICGTKWEDLDCDGKHDCGEPAVPGVTIELYDSGGNLVATTVTDKDGKYCFSALALGKYTVKEVLEEGWYAKNPSDGSQCVALWCMKPWACGVDFINARLGRIFGFKFFDQDCDGKWDCEEPRLEGVTIELWKGGNIEATTVTDENGEFAFENLMPGHYLVKEVVEEGWYPTTLNPVWVKLKCGEEEKVRFGNTRLGTIHGYKFLDEDCDGVMDEGEEGIPGVRVELKYMCGTMEAWTDESGHYSFDGLWPGLYKVILDTSTVPAGHYHTTDTCKLLWLCCCETEEVDFGNARYLTISGTKLDCYGEPVPGVTIELWQGAAQLETDTTDENGEYSFGNLLPGTYTVKEALTEEQLEEWYIVQPVGGAYENLQLSCGQDIEDLDFVNARYGSICGNKWEDLDGDGLHGEDEPPVGGVLIQLWKLVEENGPEAVSALGEDDEGWSLEGDTTTAEDGSYCFGALKPGIYRVVEVLSEEQLEEWFPVAPEAGLHDGVELACGENITDLDFLNARHGSITGFKYEDLDADGVLDEGEPGFAGAAIALKQGGEVKATTTTDADGRFSFADLEPGIYDLEEVLDAGVYTKADTLIEGVAVISGQETVLEDEYFLNYRHGSITGYKYLDADANGSLGSGDAPWDGTANPVTIELLKDGSVVKSFVIKSDDGMYFFGDLEPGAYTVREGQPLPAGMKSKAPTSITVLVSSGSDVVVDSGSYFLNYFEPVVAPEVITPPTTPQVQPELTGQLPTTGMDHMPLFLVSGMLVLLGMVALALGVMRLRRT